MLRYTVVFLILAIIGCSQPTPIPIQATSLKNQTSTISGQLQSTTHEDNLRFSVRFPAPSFHTQSHHEALLPQIKYLKLYVIGPGMPDKIWNQEGWVTVNNTPDGMTLTVTGIPKGKKRVVVALPYDTNKALLDGAILKAYYDSPTDTTNVAVTLKFSLVPVASVLEQLLAEQSPLLDILQAEQLQAIVDQAIANFQLNPTEIQPAALVQKLKDNNGQLPQIEDIVPPVITSVTPEEGLNVANTVITINGKGFLPGATVKVGTLPATNITVNSNTSITATVPAGLHSGQQTIKITNPNNLIQSLENKFNSKSGIITIAGDGTASSTGDNGPALQATVNYPYGVYLDRNSNLIIGDYLNHKIRQIDPTGIITTIAGTGNGAYSGDNGLATLAEINYPDGVLEDSQGNYYFSDYGNSVVRKIDTNGIITTIIGDGTQASTGDGGPAVNAQINGPWGVYIDANDNLYVADYRTHKIRMVPAVTGTYYGQANLIAGNIYTIVGNGSNGFSGDNGPAINAELSYPWQVNQDSLGNLYIADANNHRIRKVAPDGTITTFAGDGYQDPFDGWKGRLAGDGGPAINASLNYPIHIFIDSQDNLYISDNYNHVIRKIDTNGMITTVVGDGYFDPVGGYNGRFTAESGPAKEVSLNYPGSVYIDEANGIMYLTDSYNNRIRKVML